jgi:transposase-like protein
MAWPSWLKVRYLRTPASLAHLTKCPKCRREMRMVDRSSMSGSDMRSYRCDHCQEEHILDFGTALWKKLSDAGNSEQ